MILPNFKSGGSIRNEGGDKGLPKPKTPRPPLISARELASLLGIPFAKFVSVMASYQKEGIQPPEPALVTRSNSSSATYYHKAPALAWAKKAGLMK